MKVLVDTNVLISAAFRDRLPEKVILFLSARPDFVWISTEEIMKEYRDVLRRKKFKLTDSVIEKWEQMFEEMILMVPSSSILSFPRDQKDAKFLSCALDAGADFLITGDKDFNEAKKLTKTTILSAAQFKKWVMEMVQRT